MKFTKLTNIVTSATAVVETSISKAFDHGEIDEQEFQVLQMFHLRALNNLANVECKMEAKTITQLQKSLWEKINNLRKAARKKDAS